MRCPDCSKFVSMENNDPECDSIDATISGQSIQVCAEVRAVRACADCGTELKDLSLSLEKEIDLHDFEGYDALTDSDKEKLGAALEEESETISLDVDDDGGEMSEGGGGRYAKNMITTTINYTVTLKWERGENDLVTLTHSSSMEEQNAASEFEECC